MCIPLEWTPATKGLKNATRAASTALSVSHPSREKERWKEREIDKYNLKK